MASLSPFGRSSKDIMNVMQRLQGGWCCISVLYLTEPSSGSVSQEEFCWFSTFTPRVSARCLLLHKCTIFDRTGTYPLEKSILMLYIMAVRVCPFIFKLMFTSCAAHVTLMVLQTQKCPEGIMYFHYDGLWMLLFISWWFELTGCVLQCLRTSCFSPLLTASICVVMLSAHFWT